MTLSEITHKKLSLCFWVVTLLGVTIPIAFLLFTSPTTISGNEFVKNDSLTICNSIDTICINHATEAELSVLVGIGPTKATAIVDYRILHGYFNTKEEIMSVKGIGEGIFEEIKDDIRV